MFRYFVSPDPQNSRIKTQSRNNFLFDGFIRLLLHSIVKVYDYEYHFFKSLSWRREAQILEIL